MALTLLGNNPLLSPVLNFPDEFSSLLDAGPLRTFFKDTTAAALTAVDVRETPDTFEFIADLPGLNADTVRVTVEDDNVLTISGERVREKHEDNEVYHRVERSVGRFSRRFRLPENADIGKITAQIDEGVLRVRVPKRQEKKEEKPQAIDVNVTAGGAQRGPGQGQQPPTQA